MLLQRKILDYSHYSPIMELRMIVLMNISVLVGVADGADAGIRGGSRLTAKLRM